MRTLHKLSLLCISMMLSTKVSAAIIDVVGWDDYTSPPRVVSDTNLDDDATGKSTSTGVVVMKPNASNIDKNKDIIDCSSHRFDSLGKQLNLNITKQTKEAKTYAEYLTEKDRTEMEKQIASARNYANDRANQAQNNSQSYSNTKYNQSINHTNDRVNKAQNSAKSYSDTKYTQSINHTNWVRSDTRSYADTKYTQSINYANDRANQAQNNAKGYSDSKYTQSISYANDRVNQSQNTTKTYIDRKYTQSINHANNKYNQSNQYTDNAIANNQVDINLKTIHVQGSEARGHWSKSYAQCPSNTKMVGGGYILTTFNGGHGYNAPNGSYPETQHNRWVVSRGGMGEDRGFVAFAVCLQA